MTMELIQLLPFFALAFDIVVWLYKRRKEKDASTN